MKRPSLQLKRADLLGESRFAKGLTHCPRDPYDVHLLLNGRSGSIPCSALEAAALHIEGHTDALITRTAAAYYMGDTRPSLYIDDNPVIEHPYCHQNMLINSFLGVNYDCVFTMCLVYGTLQNFDKSQPLRELHFKNKDLSDGFIRYDARPRKGTSPFVEDPVVRALIGPLAGELADRLHRDMRRSGSQYTATIGVDVCAREHWTDARPFRDGDYDRSSSLPVVVVRAVVMGPADAVSLERPVPEGIDYVITTSPVVAGNARHIRNPRSFTDYVEGYVKKKR